MRVILTIVAVEMLKLPYLKIVGGLLLFWIAVQLLVPEDDDGDGGQGQRQHVQAIRTILIADLVMSLDNVIGVAAAAKGDNVLLMLGLAISIPLIIFGSTILLKLMDRFPIIITGGAALLGWVAGEMLITDPILVGWIAANMPWMEIHLPLVGEISWAQIVGAVTRDRARARWWQPAPRPRRPKRSTGGGRPALNEVGQITRLHNGNANAESIECRSTARTIRCVRSIS